MLIFYETTLDLDKSLSMLYTMFYLYEEVLQMRRALVVLVALSLLVVGLNVAGFAYDDEGGVMGFGYDPWPAPTEDTANVWYNSILKFLHNLW
jgi:hypothetical protein